MAKKDGMTHRERVLTALARREPDRVPIDIAATKCTSIHRVAYQNLIAHLGLGARPGTIWDPMQQIVMPEEDLLERLDVDTRALWAGAPDGFVAPDLGRRTITWTRGECSSTARPADSISIFTSRRSRAM